MQLIDLSHIMENGMPAYPGEESPTFEFKNVHQSDGYQVIRFKALTHSGTHLDTPAHFFANGVTLDNLPVDRFYGKGFVVDCSNFGAGQEIAAGHLKSFEKDLEKAEFAMIYTDWDKHWGTDLYYGEFPALSVEAAIYLSQFKLKGIGLDVPSLDPVTSPNYPNHLHLLGKGFIIIENLKNLHLLNGREFHFAAFPWNIKSGDGCPVRAVGIIASGAEY